MHTPDPARALRCSENTNAARVGGACAPDASDQKPPLTVTPPLTWTPGDTSYVPSSYQVE
jgi:hypothetical protein